MKVLTLLIFFWIGPSFGQIHFYELDPLHSSVRLQGDSSLHEWAMEAEHITVQATATSDSKNAITFKDLELKILISGLQSEKKSMDERAHKALRASEHPYIIFDFDELVSLLRNGNSADFVARGELSLAGETRTVDVAGNVKVANGSALITGEHEIEMSDYKIDPPSMMFIKTRNKVKVTFNLKLVQKE